MLRRLRLTAGCACIVASVGCDGGKLTPPPSPPVEFGGRVVNADAGDPVSNVRVSVHTVRFSGRIGRSDGQCNVGWRWHLTLSVNLLSDWSSVSLKLSGPGYDDGGWRFEPNTGGTRAEIRIYPTLVIRPGESRLVRVEPTVNRCGFAGPFSVGVSWSTHRRANP